MNRPSGARILGEESKVPVGATIIKGKPMSEKRKVVELTVKVEYINPILDTFVTEYPIYRFCPACGAKAKFIRDHHGPMASGYVYWSCTDLHCSWNEISG